MKNKTENSRKQRAAPSDIAVMPYPITTTDGETWLAPREDRKSFLNKIGRLIDSANSYLSKQKLENGDIERIADQLFISDILKAIASALHAHSFPGFARRSTNLPVPPSSEVVKRLQDFAAVYIIKVGAEMIEALSKTDSPSVHVDTAVDIAQYYSEIVLCRMVLNLPEVKTSALKDHQRSIATLSRQSPLNVAIREILQKRGAYLSAKEVDRILPPDLRGRPGLKDRVSREREKLSSP